LLPALLAAARAAGLEALVEVADEAQAAAARAAGADVLAVPPPSNAAGPARVAVSCRWREGALGRGVEAAALLRAKPLRS